MQLEGAFCVACALFSSSRVKGRFVMQPFQTWQKCKEHECCGYHQDAQRQTVQLIQTVEHPESGIPALVDAKIAASVKINRAVLKSIAGAVLFCITLRGDSENNPGDLYSPTEATIDS